MPPGMQRKEHWDKVYSSKSDAAVSWYRPRLETSLALLEEAGMAGTSRIIDVGGGASTLVDDLVGRGMEHVTVLDVSAVPLEHARARLGDAAAGVEWLEGDIITLELPQQSFDLWHDRAVFHFLTETQDRRRYLATLRRALRPGGHVVLCTFAEDGPLKCSGLDTVRYSADDLMAEVGPDLRLLRTVKERHRTPRGSEQIFRYFLMQVVGEGE
jgi:ubiquinone/menaquinone biosynthesis C-methylase UbiE